jgi:DnaJ like chaperone protein
MPLEDIRKVFRKLVRENHPDAMIARGVPEEALVLAQKRMADVNRAWEEIRAQKS